MSTIPHRIFRQNWQVYAGSAEEAFTLRKQIRERWEDTLIPVFEKVFNEHSKEEMILYIPKLEIRMKVDNDREIWKNIPEALYDQLISLFRHETTYRVSEPETAQSWKKIPGKAYNFELLIQYLQQGNLPWQVSTFPHETVEVLKETIAEQWNNLVHHLRTNEPSEIQFFRLFQLLPEEKVILLSQEISEKIPPLWREELSKLLKALLNSSETNFSFRTRLLLASGFLRSCIQVNYQYQVPNLLYEAVRILGMDELASFRHFIDSLPRNSFFYYAKTTEHYSGSVRTGFRRISEEETRDLSAIRNVTSEFTPDENSENNLADIPLNKPETPSLQQYSPIGYPLQKSDAIQEPIVSNPSCQKLENGGLLLLHPFVKGFFTHTGLLTDKVIPVGNLPRAAALLHYLATGSEEVYEFELGFVKILLGMNPDQSLAVSKGLLTPQDKEEVESLLNSVIHHWSVLKNSSIDALRSCFLQRYALLYNSDECWKVRLESNAFDVLLSRLPWSYSVVKLPWMNKPIYTEWQTN